MSTAPCDRRRPMVLLVVCTVTAFASAADAQVVRLEVTTRDSLENGRVFAAAGAYEVIRGRFHGEVDPSDRRNRIIQDIGLARRTPGVASSTSPPTRWRSPWICRADPVC